MPDNDVVPLAVFRLLWIGVAVAYVVCGTVLSAYGLLYFLMLQYTTDALYNIALLGVDLHLELYPYMGVATLAIAVIHLYHFMKMILRSIKARSLQFSSSFAPNENLLSSRVTRAISTTFDAFLPSRLSYIGYTIRALRDVAVSLWKAFDVTSPNYGVMYFLRELIQTGIQTQQAYELSARVAKTWMNHCIVVLLVINCWAMPLIKHVFKVSATPTSRLICLLVNLVLDFVSYLAFPIALFVPYARDFDYKLLNFGSNKWYTEKWIIQLPSEWPLVFVTSLGGASSRLLIIYSMTRTLRAIAKLVQPGEIVFESSAVDRHGPASVVPNPLTPPPDKNALVIRSVRVPSAHVLRSRAERWGHRMLTLWGLVVLVLHIQASSTPTNPQCLLQVRPWFVGRSACSLMEMNCYQSHLTGNASDFDATLDSIDSQWVSYLVIRHCGAVEITPRIQDLTLLMGIKIYNSTLVKWDTDAALTQSNHPNVLFALVLASNVTSFPEALHHPDFPLQLKDIEFSYVNLTHVPHEVSDLWHPGTFLAMERLQLPEFPEALAKLEPSYFSLAYNNFSYIPESVFQNPQLLVLVLNGNLINELPSGDYKVATLSIVQTNITKIPAWLDTSSHDIALQAGLTPLCEALRQRHTSVLGLSSDTETETWQQLVDCSVVDKSQYFTTYPLAEEATNNPSKTSR